MNTPGFVDFLEILTPQFSRPARSILWPTMVIKLGYFRIRCHFSTRVRKREHVRFPELHEQEFGYVEFLVVLNAINAGEKVKK